MTRLILLLLAAAPWLCAEAPTFARDVAPILYRRCAPCHRPGQSAPFSLLTYRDAAKRARFIADVAASGYMPPWHAESGDVKFSNDRRLSSSERAVLAAWAEAGAPEGERSKIPPPPRFASGWQIGEPDLVVKMNKPFPVAADGPDLYRDFVLDMKLDRPRWVRALEFRPGPGRVVHHALVFLVPRGENPRLWRNRRRVLTWAIGSNPFVLPEGVGLRLEPDMQLVVQLHIHPTGKPEPELSSVGLYFADDAPKRRFIELPTPPDFGRMSGIRIPAGSDRYTLTESFTLPVDVRAFAVFPHAHNIGKAFQLTAYLPSGEQKTLLRVDDFDFTWQEYYFFQDPLPLPLGTRLETKIRWDNTAENPRNPFSPPRDIPWGMFSVDEMGYIALDVVAVRPEDEPVLHNALREHFKSAALNFWLSSGGTFTRGPRNPFADRWLRSVEEFAIARFDADRDGRLSESERIAARANLHIRGFDEGLQRPD